MAPAAFALKLASIAQEQHNMFHMMDETEPPLCAQIKKYWQGIAPFVSCSTVPWSAVFVSFCVKKAGAAAAEFKFSAQHSVFVHQAIKNATNNTGVFRGVDITKDKPAVGDIIQNNRNGETFNFQFAKNNADYASHSAIVVETGVDSEGGFALTIGGNEGDSIRRKIVRLDAQGFIKQRTANPFISLIKNLKT
ncbi:MAG: DUF2272 domain-containing protein [Pyrinomonadaceae bacterium]|nr:DUF2272 domain-containing protein [Pyrinomonadaceae bacterium]